MAKDETEATRLRRKHRIGQLPPFEEPSESRSRNMAAIRGLDTKPEWIVRSAVHRAGFRFRLHRRDLPGRPDLTFSRYRTAVFVHGCFWHGHACKIGHVPRSNTAYWSAKIARNVERDRRNIARLGEDGWQVVVIRECSMEADTAGLIDFLRTQREQRTQLTGGSR